MKLQLIYVALMGLCVSCYMASPKPDVSVDQQGVLRWPDQREVQGFGVNYTVPFAHAYRTAKKLGVDPKIAIDNDVYHFARLGFDAYRVHVWDTEISDSLGNLLVNEHLELFDYMVYQMKQRGMKFIITPIAFWGNGWPEPNEDTPGFSNKYGKDDCLTNLEAILAQENYLAQFISHINPYTGMAYKDDPDVVAFEVSNEPHHDQSADLVTKYVSKMVKSMKSTGCQKPILYNVSHSIHLADAYYEAGIDGGTFQWYPTGLGAGEEIGGNLLPNVDNYDIPFKNHEGFQKGAKIVYEFDAADVGRSYIYPAMARSFRTAGIQWATHFSYDPTYMAYANTEYDTHYMNLVYAPQKALSLKIAAEVFHKVPMYMDYGNYQTNAVFDDFRVSYEKDLAEYVGDGKFFYTNHTETQPNKGDELKEIAGFGNSPLVKYEGLGAYFLDQIESGVWRLEVMPDALWTKNLFGDNSLDQTLAVINWRTWPMQINLADLGADFKIQGINEGNDLKAQANGQVFDINPGTYLIANKNKEINIDPASEWQNIVLNEYTATPTTLKESEVLHRPAESLVEGSVYQVKATIVTREAPAAVFVRLADTNERFEMNKKAGYQYEAKLPKASIKQGELKYRVVVEQSESLVASTARAAQSSDAFESDAYEVNVVASGAPLYLFEADKDFEELNMVWDQMVQPKTFENGNTVLNVQFDSIPQDEANTEPNYAMRYYFGNKIIGRQAELSRFKELVIRGHGESKPVEVALITKSAEIYGQTMILNAIHGDYRISIDDLTDTELVTLPRPYPGFLPYYAEKGTQQPLDLSEGEAIQISIGPGLSATQCKEHYGLQIQSIRLE